MVEDDERGGVFDCGKDVFDDGGGVFDGATAVWLSLLTLEDGMSLSEVLISDGILFMFNSKGQRRSISFSILFVEFGLV